MLRHYFRQAGHLATQAIFARKRFKLLLRGSLQDMDSRIQGVTAASNFFSNFVRPVVIDAPFGKSMLVIAPHQDDEAIGCGGALALQVRSGQKSVVMILEDGAGEYDQVSMKRDALRDLRNNESRSAAEVIGAEEPIFLNSEDLRKDIEKLVVAMKSVIREREVDAIFVPFVLDGNMDHKVCDVIVAKALKELNRPLRVFQYEVWGNCIPNVVVIIDKVIQQKDAMLSCFRFANAAFDYAHATKGLNMMHSRLLPSGKAKYVEAYFETPREEFIELVCAVSKAEGGRLAV